MEKVEYQNMYNEEDTHFYYVPLHKMILWFLKKYLSNNPRLRGNNKLRILDAGCGTGRLAQLMQPYGMVTGIDMSDEALKFARKRGISVKKASVNQLPFSANNFNVVTSIDVLVSKSVDDTKALYEFHRVLKPHGILIIRVSAIPWLKLSHDRFVHSNKRYTKEMFRQKLEKSGFKVKKISYMNALLAPAGVVQHIYEKFMPSSNDHSSIKRTNSLINNTATGILTLESKLLHSMNLPFGMGVFAIARKE